MLLITIAYYVMISVTAQKSFKVPTSDFVAIYHFKLVTLSEKNVAEMRLAL
jgi:hypothetical protein